MSKSFERGWVEDWQGRRGILKTEGSDAWFFVRAYNMEPDGQDLRVKAGEKVAFQWMHEGNRMVVSRCVRLQHLPLPREWAREEWPPKVGKWTPMKRIGQGGNGEVWRAESNTGEVVAIKFLRRTGPEAYIRFRTEVEIMQALQGIKGILPQIDSRFPDKPSDDEPAWFAMPIARPFRESNAITRLEELVEAFAQIAETLAEIHGRDISHRDIKPDNLFWLDDTPMIGDFGLVDFPGKESLTGPHKKLGPIFYIAPEMLNEPHYSDGKPADVYSFAKSFWVLATGQNFPIPGEHRDSVYQTRLSAYVGHRRARDLDRLIAQCTRHDARQRPSMATVAADLRLWLGGKLEGRYSFPRGCSERELAKVAVQLTDPLRLILHCRQCGQGWSPNIRSGGKLPPGYWKCPRGCNSS